MQETNAAAINIRWFYFAALIFRNSTMNNNNFLRKDKGRLRKKVQNLGHCPKFGYPLPPPLNLGHPYVKYF